eukprot:scaffold59538_cov61-Phaeocystis_antarctica.AAC.12
MELLEPALDLGLGACLSPSPSPSLTAGRCSVQLLQLCDQDFLTDQRLLERRALRFVAREELLLLTEHTVEQGAIIVQLGFKTLSFGVRLALSLWEHLALDLRARLLVML